MSESVVERKAALRRGIRASRSARNSDDYARASQALTGHLAQLVTQYRPTCVTAYLSTPIEPDTRGFLAWARGQQLRVLLPISCADGLLDWVRPEWDASGRLVETTGRHRMPEPVGEPLGPDAVTEATLLLIPAAAADRTGGRLGWGKGYYDRALARLTGEATVFAIVFDDELLDEVPREDHDRPIDGIVTPRGIIRIS